MAAINELLEEIMSAVYGEDVREAIHDAIQQCYLDATGNPASVSALTQDVTDLQTFAANLYEVVEVNATNLSVSSNSVEGFTASVNAPTGYTPVALMAFWMKNHELTCSFLRVDLSTDGTLAYRIRNSSTVDSWSDLNVYFKVLCIKDFAS